LKGGVLIWFGEHFQKATFRRKTDLFGVNEFIAPDDIFFKTTNDGKPEKQWGYPVSTPRRFTEGRTLRFDRKVNK